ncbi:EAL domain-containing protein, partial [Pseudomonas sp. 2822-17]|uniref:EAL domain-containing protein n=1 Tax=Pseudomonas sp. 2822-17 TaxID=1712678 RepID=UPI00130443C3
IKVIETKENQMIISTFVDLANALNLDVIVEGIETADQKETIINLGCEKAQGFLFSKPLPPPEMENLLHNGCHVSDERVVVIENRRKYQRFSLQKPVHGKTNITSISGETVNMGTFDIS